MNTPAARGSTPRLRSSAIAFRPAFALMAALLPAGGAAGQDAQAILRDTAAAERVIAAVRAQDTRSALESLGEAVDQRGPGWREDDWGIASAAAGVYRATAQLSPDERFELWRNWTMPNDGRDAVRLLTTPVPRTAPPRQFAREIGERPSSDAFPIASINNVPALFCSGWELLRAADEVGRLSRLTAELEPLAQQGTPRAAELLAMVRLADRRIDAAQAATLLAQLAAHVREQHSTDPQFPVNPAELAIAAAALRHEELRGVAVDLLSALVDAGRPTQTPRLCAALRVAHAVALQLHLGESDPASLWGQTPEHWVAVTGGGAAEHAAGGPAALWLSQEDYILHAAGTGADVLLCRYPLIGDFEFHCEAQEGGEFYADGGLVYGGLGFEPTGQNQRVWLRDADFLHPFEKPCYFLRHEASQPTFNRYALRSRNDGAQFLTNLHPVWFDDEATLASPWLGLVSTGGKRPLFRNLRITGDPVIPREVRLSRGDELRGWRAAFLGESQPAFEPHSRPAGDAPESHPAATEQADWRIQDGVISASRRKTPDAAHPQSLLQYQRPLLDSESITYEFRYQPGEFECHPALGRLVFLLDPGGVKIHWITDGALEWTGLSPDNETLEPLNRRGPRPLPLKEGDWNTITVARSDGKTSLSLNGELIYVRPSDGGGEDCFGLYANCNSTAVQVRNVVMTGDWPESLPTDFLLNPTATAASPALDQHVRQRLFGTIELADNAAAVLRRTWKLPPGERLDRLAEWVLPGDAHSDFRLAGVFSQTQPSPLARALSPELQRSNHGADLAAPALDLIDVAAELNRLEHLGQRVQEIPPPPDELGKRSRLALLALIALKQGRQEQADAALTKLLDLVSNSQPAAWFEMWPEALVALRGMERHHDSALVQELVGYLYSARVMTQSPRGADGCLAHIAVLRGLQRCLKDGLSHEEYNAAPALRDWIPAVRSRARSRGDGYPLAHWRLSDEFGLEHLAGHQEEVAFYGTPLKPPFEVNGEMYGHGTSQLLIGGTLWGVRSERTLYETGSFRGGSQRLPLDRPTAKMDHWIPFRATARDGMLEVTVHGRVLHREPITADFDPWLGLRSWWRNTARMRDVRVTGSGGGCPQVNLSKSPDMDGWLSYYDESTGGPQARWHVAQEENAPPEIIGEPFLHMAGSFVESLLRYQRPLVEGGTVEYEFWYEPGRFNTHPALDRLAFLIEPSGVRIHWITDSWYDPTVVSPDNETVEPQCRRGPEELPLQPLAWNRLALSIAGDVVSLHVNDVLVYERPLEPENLRTFGLFHFSEQSAVRVRNVVMRGNWPPVPPTLEEQELTDKFLLRLDAERDALADTFHHDFRQDGLPVQFFKPLGIYSFESFQHTPEGVRAAVASDGGWTSMPLSPRFAIHGDFDLEAGVTGVNLDNCAGQSAMDLFIKLADQKELRTSRAKKENGDHFLKAQLSNRLPDGSRNYQDHVLHDDTTEGRLRIARRGETMYMLYAQDDSPRFRLIGAWPASDVEVPFDGLRLQVNAPRQGFAIGDWTHVTLRADRLTYMPPDAVPRPSLYVMDAADGGVREVLAPLSDYTQVGSPEWSPDGAQIALDMSRGSTSTSRIVVIDADGENFRDIGAGSMPSFSPDGKQVAVSISGQGVAVMNVDGSDLRIIDRAGWGVCWTPNRNAIIYAKSGNLILYDLAANSGRELLQGEDAQRYSYIYWNFSCSPDGKSVAFRGRLRTGAESELAVVTLEPPVTLRALIETPPVFNPDVSWSPDSRQVLITRPNAAGGDPRFQLAPADGSAPPSDLPGQPDGYFHYGGAWSRDGRSIVFAAKRAPEPLEWPLAAEPADPSPSTSPSP